MTVYVVIWDNLNPRPLGVFSDKAAAERLARKAEGEINGFYERLGLSGQRVYVCESTFEQAEPTAPRPRIHGRWRYW